VSLSPAQVRHIAKLARLTLSEQEVSKFSRELTQILDYVGKLQKVDTKGVEPLQQMTGLAHVTRADRVLDQSITTEALLGQSPLPIVDQQIETPSAHGER
jgi:aspartyl-tRNA(Asn)/glutamyl-tRNA(Gln) amidotransferase subunit C